MLLNNIKILLILILTLTIHQIKAQDREEERVIHEPFTKISIDGDFKIILRKGDDPSVKIQSRGIEPENISSKVQNGELLIKRKLLLKNAFSPSKATIEIVFRDLEELSLDGSLEVTVKDKLKSDNLMIEVKSSCDLKVRIEAKKLDLKVKGAADATLSGQVQNEYIKLVGSGEVRAFNLEAEKSDISITGSGNAYVSVSKSIDARITGSGDIHYKGAVEEISIKTFGSGRLKKKG